MASKELNPRKSANFPKNLEQKKTKQIQKKRKGRKKSTISNFLITTFNMIDVKLKRIPKARGLSYGTRTALRSLSKTLRISPRCSASFSKPKTTLPSCASSTCTAFPK